MRRGVWIVRRARLRVESFPRFGEPVTLRTFCSGLGRFSAERRTTIRGATAAVDAVALWVWIDAETRARAVPASGSSSSTRRAPPAAARRSGCATPSRRRTASDGRGRFRAADIDVAGHVNNSHYWAPLEEQLAGAEPDAVDVEIEHREPASAGGVVVAACATRALAMDRRPRRGRGYATSAVQLSPAARPAAGHSDGGRPGGGPSQAGRAGSSASSAAFSGARSWAATVRRATAITRLRLRCSSGSAHRLQVVARRLDQDHAGAAARAASSPRCRAGGPRRAEHERAPFERVQARGSGAARRSG